MTKEEMDMLAQENLSDNYTGEAYDNEVEAIEFYDGSDDDSVDFTGGAKSFKNEIASDKRFRFTIENTTAVEKVIVLTPGSFPVLRVMVPDPTTKEYDAVGGAKLVSVDGNPVIMYDNPSELVKAGFPVDAVLDDGIIYKDAEGSVSVTAPDTSRVRFLREYLKSNPSRVVRMSFTSTLKEFFDTPLVLQEVSPYRRNGEDRIELQDYFKPGQYQDNKIVVDKGFQLDDVTVAYMTIPAGCKINATLNIGAVERQGLALKRKAERAIENKGRTKIMKVMPKRKFSRR